MGPAAGVAWRLLLQSSMKKLWERLEAAFAAVAFAEEGEVETARRMIAAGDADATPPAEGSEQAGAARGTARGRAIPLGRKIARLP